MADLTNEQKQFFSSMETTFDTVGWTLLTQGWKEEQGRLSDQAFFNAKSMDDVRETRIRFSLLGELLALPEQIATQKQAILDGEGDE